MQPTDVQQEYNRLSQYYRGLRDEELENVATEAYDLTEVAHECLSFEISSRGLKIPLTLERPSLDGPEPLPPADDGFVPEDEDLTPISTANDPGELRRVTELLSQGGFEYFLGDDKVREVKDLRDNMEAGVEVAVWNAEAQRAMGFLAQNTPSNVSYDPKDDCEEALVCCPQCKSDGVIFEERDIKETGGKLRRNSKFRWRCDDCGYEWEDEGIAS